MVFLSWIGSKNIFLMMSNPALTLSYTAITRIDFLLLTAAKKKKKKTHIQKLTDAKERRRTPDLKWLDESCHTAEPPSVDFMGKCVFVDSWMCVSSVILEGGEGFSTDRAADAWAAWLSLTARPQTDTILTI